MNRWTCSIAAVVILVAMGCSNGGGTPVTPSNELTNKIQNTGTVQTHLWGYYDVYIDIEAQTAEAVLNRSAMFAANVVQFVNNPATNLGFLINETPVTAEYVDVDIDVSIKHPFTGLDMYNGYDVRGVFMGEASGSLAYNSALEFGVLGTDQVMLPDPDDGDGAPDGFTRWFNAAEFTTPGLFGYLQGKFATPGYSAPATLCPYKYFADGLGATDNLWDFLTTTADNGVFSAGTTNTRNYYLRFPLPTPNVKYGYAIVANWVDETTHPANAPETQGLSVTVTDNIYFVDGTDKGGDLILDISAQGWNYQPSTIYVESNVLTAVHPFDAAEMTPTGGADTYSTYHVEIPSDNVTSTGGNEFWVVCEYGDFDYTNEYGVTNGAGADLLAAFFRYDLFVAAEPYNQPPTCDVQVVTAMPHVGKGRITFDATGSSDPDGDPLTYSWDFNGDLVFADTYDSGTDDMPMKNYTVPGYVGDVVVEVSDGVNDPVTCSVAVDVTALREINVTGTPNVSLGTDLGTGKKDIGIDPATDQAGINYAGTQQWKKAATDYTSLTTYSNGWRKSNWDAGSWGFFLGGDIFNSGNFPIWTQTSWAGTGGSGTWYGVDTAGMRDTANCIGDPGNSTVYGFYDLAAFGYSMFLTATSMTGYSNFSYGFTPWYNGTGSTGVVMANLKAIDLAKYTSGNHTLYTLEGGSSIGVEKWTLPAGSSYPTYVSGWGSSLLINPLDMSVDTDDNLYVLDKLANGRPIVYAYSNAGVLIGTSEEISTTDISGNPLRLDVSISKTPDEEVVLHANGVTRFSMTAN